MKRATESNATGPETQVASIRIFEKSIMPVFHAVEGSFCAASSAENMCIEDLPCLTAATSLRSSKYPRPHFAIASIGR